MLRVTRYDPRTRRTLAVLAEGLTTDAARALAATLRADDPAHGYAVEAMPLAQQVRLLAAGETVRALAA